MDRSLMSSSVPIFGKFPLIKCTNNIINNPSIKKFNCRSIIFYKKIKYNKYINLKILYCLNIYCVISFLVFFDSRCVVSTPATFSAQFLHRRRSVRPFSRVPKRHIGIDRLALCAVLSASATEYPSLELFYTLPSSAATL